MADPNSIWSDEDVKLLIKLRTQKFASIFTSDVRQLHDSWIILADNFVSDKSFTTTQIRKKWCNLVRRYKVTKQAIEMTGAPNPESRKFIYYDDLERYFTSERGKKESERMSTDIVSEGSSESKILAEAVKSIIGEYSKPNVDATVHLKLNGHVEDAQTINGNDPLDDGASINDDTRKWNSVELHQLLKFRLQLKKQFEAPDIDEDILWSHISMKLNQIGHLISMDRCKQKFHIMTEKYKYFLNIYKQQKCVKWSYFKRLHEILSTDDNNNISNELKRKAEDTTIVVSDPAKKFKSYIKIVDDEMQKRMKLVQLHPRNTIKNESNVNTLSVGGGGGDGGGGGVGGGGGGVGGGGVGTQFEYVLENDITKCGPITSPIKMVSNTSGLSAKRYQSTPIVSTIQSPPPQPSPSPLPLPQIQPTIRTPIPSSTNNFNENWWKEYFDRRLKLEERKLEFEQEKIRKLIATQRQIAEQNLTAINLLTNAIMDLSNSNHINNSNNFNNYGNNNYSNNDSSTNSTINNVMEEIVTMNHHG